MGDLERLDRDDLHRIAADERRRAIVATIRDRGERAVSVDELVATIAEGEARPATAGSIDRRTAIEIELLHLHLPMLHETGLIDFDRERQRVTPRTRLERVDELLSGESEREPSRRRRH